MANTTAGNMGGPSGPLIFVMSVELVTITPDAEQLIIDCARVSNPANQGKPGEKLLRYLIEHHHWSPFEMANMVVKIETSRAISAQIVRHRSFSFQEFSQRYAEAPSVSIYPARRQDEKNRQNSINDLGSEDQDWFWLAQERLLCLSQGLYQDALARGIAKECARFLLPLSTDTTLYMNGTIRSWIHYLHLRTANGTQQEHMEVARGIASLFSEQMPTIAAACNLTH